MTKKKPVAPKKKNEEQVKKSTEPDISETGTKEEVSEEDALKELQDAIDRMPVKDMIVNMMMSLASTAYKKLGLPEETNGKHKDPAQAKQAIDALDALVGCIGPDMEPRDAESFRQTVANLKMAYVQVK